ncbi:MAG TPA: ABC transporter permease [Candidatus Angelobacter sp.]
MKTYLSLIAIDLKLAGRQRAVIFFNYLFPLIFFFIFAMIFPVRRSPAVMTQVLTMSISLGVLGNGLFGAGIRALQEREMNILRRYKVTPITPTPLLVASMVTGWFVFMPYIILVISLAHLIYHMPWPAHLPSLFVFISIGLIAFRSIGLVIASVANTMQEGTILVQLCYFPMLFLSGATVPADIFPRLLQVVSNFIPATYLVFGMRGIMLNGDSLWQDWKPLAALLVTTAVGLTVGTKLFRWEKEEKIRKSAKIWIVAVLLPFVLLGLYQAISGHNIVTPNVFGP